MQILTIATKAEGYFPLLQQSSERWGYSLTALGWEQEWQGFAWKLRLYQKALASMPEEEPVVCVDGYDVVVLGPAAEVLDKFIASGQRVLFSGQRYFPNHRWMQKIADKVMSHNLQETITRMSTDPKDYSRPCMGLLIGYAGDLAKLFQNLLDIEVREQINDDQTLLNMFYLQHPDALALDLHCEIFQNLWRTSGLFYGKFSSKSKKAEVAVYFDEKANAFRIRNKDFLTTPCFIHGPFNLDMRPLLRELKIPAPNIHSSKGWNYWQYSIIHHAIRGIRLFTKIG